jgi:O-antigen ligase
MRFQGRGRLMRETFSIKLLPSCTISLMVRAPKRSRHYRMSIFPDAVRLDRTFFAILADGFAIGVAVALPWSTSAASILVAVWLVFVLAALDPSSIKRELSTAAGALPVLLWCLGAVGVLWADVSWIECFQGLGSFNRLLMIPLLLAQFHGSERGKYVILGFFTSSTIVLIVSFVLVLAHMATRPDKLIGIPVHDDIFQNTEFLACSFGVLGVACDGIRRRHWAATLNLFVIAALFLINISVVIFSRIALIVAPILVVLLGWRLFRWKGVLGACVAAVLVGAFAWLGSSDFRLRLDESALEVHEYRTKGAATSLGEHAEFLRESLSIVAAAPVIGHGTGSIPEQFRRVTAGKTGVWAIATNNPHNQTFAVAIQLGFVGAVVLWAMWIAHLYLFRGESVTAWLGLVVVVQNIVFSTVHSHLFDFASGWLYVFAVGVLGGMVLKERSKQFNRGQPSDG